MTEELREALRAAGRVLWESGLVSSHGGNMSVRLGEGGLLVTRTGSMLGRLEEGDLVTVAADGSADGEPSMDTPVHRAIFAGTEAGAVLHAHPRYAVALSLASDVVEPVDVEGKLKLGSVPVVDAEQVAAALREAPIVLARGHGSYARGDDLWRALELTSVLEESAQVLWLGRVMGNR